MLRRGSGSEEVESEVGPSASLSAVKAAAAAHTCSHFSRVTRGWLVPTRFRIMPTQLGLLVNSQKMKSHAGHGLENAYLHYRHYRIFTVPLELWNYDTGPPTYSDSAGEKVSL